jgi:hypothetical protein
VSLELGCQKSGDLIFISHLRRLIVLVSESGFLFI